MSFFEKIISSTIDEKKYLYSAPLLVNCQKGVITLPQYVTFLSQAYHHVKHTVPLLMATGSRLTDKYEWLRKAIAEYIDEEIGHEEWILNDISACGADAELVRNSLPAPATEFMVSYAYDSVSRLNPASFFGMVYVLESTSVELATPLGQITQDSLTLPPTAMSYLYSHGSLDIKHMDFFKSLMNKIDSPDDQQAIIHMAKRMYFLYGNMFRSITDNEV